MNFSQIVSLVMTLLGKREELTKIIQEVIAIFNRVNQSFPQLGELIKNAGAGAAAPAMSVNWLQESLNKLVDAKLTVDGKYGDATHDAVRKFQTAHGLTVDGWAGIETQAAIVNALK